MTSLLTTRQNRLGWFIAATVGVLLFAAFTAWGGIPTDERAGPFWAQMGILFVVTCAFVWLFWHLMLRPLAPNLRQPKTDTLSGQIAPRHRCCTNWRRAGAYCGWRLG